MPLVKSIFARHTDSHDMAWSGEFSHCHARGLIVSTIEQIIAGLEKPITFVLPMADGYSNTPNFGIGLKDRASFESNIHNANTIVGILCTRDFADSRAFLMPLDDETFESGAIATVGKRTTLPAWEDRKPIAYWRGCLSGGYAPTPRTRTVWELYDFPLADVKLTRVHRPLAHPLYQGRLIFEQDTRFYDDARGLADHVRHKYILILDGNCIASAHQWVFASGSVPIMITHPDNDWWFRKYLKPMFHYVPVKYDLSDLREKIEWLVANDDKAKEIANNALEFARTVLSSEFQHGYLLKEIKRAAGV